MQLQADDLQFLTRQAILAAKAAGQAIANFPREQLIIDHKLAGSSLASQVVTEVDHLSEAIILEHLQPLSHRYDLALLSEETPDDGSRHRHDYFWCIDPLDGTLPFIEAKSGYSVVIALVARSGVPLIGVIYDPLAHTLYHAEHGIGAYINGQRLAAPIALGGKPECLTFITDKSFQNDPLYPDFVAALPDFSCQLGVRKSHLLLQGGAAINACQTYNDAPACYFKFPKSHSGGGCPWDYAATRCWLAAAGGWVSDCQGLTLDLNPTGSLYFNHCGVLFSSHKAISQAVLAFLNARRTAQYA